MPQSLRGDPFSAGELDLWVQRLQQTQQFVSSWGGKLLVVVAPNKASIYPEKLPAVVRASRGEPRLDAFLQRLQRNHLDAIDAVMLALHGWADEEVEVPALQTKAAEALPLTPYEVAAGQFVFEQQALCYEGADAAAPKILVHHDSFGVPLRAVMAHAFSRSTWLYTPLTFNHAVMQREQPDVVVLVMAERYLHRGPPGLPFGSPPR